MAVTFDSLNQTARNWIGLTVLGTDVYASVYIGKIYKQTGGAGDFNLYYDSVGNWGGLAVKGSDIYAINNGTGIRKQTNATGTFDAYSSPSVWLYDIAINTNGDIYVTNEDGMVHKQTGGSGAWSTVLNVSAPRGIVAVGNDIYVGTLNGSIYKQTNSTGAFVNLNQTARYWWGFTHIESDVYACDGNNGYIYKQTGGTGNFDLFYNGAGRQWRGMIYANGKIYAAVASNDNIYAYQAFVPTISSITPSADIAFSADINISGSDLQGTESTILKIDGTTYSTISISSTSVHFSAPELSAGNHTVKLTVDGIDTNEVTITYPLPSLTSITPSEDIIYGYTLTIAGNGLQGVSTQVLSIDSEDYSANIISSTSLEVVFSAPNFEAGSHAVKMVIDGNDSNSINISYPFPYIDSITPDSSVMGGDTLTISGKGLLGVGFNTLLIGGEDYTANIISETSLEIVFTAPDLPSGTYSVQIQVDDGWYSNAYQISYEFPLITNVDPAGDIQSGGLITIQGEYLQGTTSTEVYIGAENVTSYVTSVSETEITLIAPDLPAGSYPVKVVLDGTRDSNEYQISYTSQEVTMQIRSPLLYQHFENDDGSPLEYGKVHTFYAGTSTPLATLDSSGAENPNPYILDVAGNGDINLKPGCTYKFVIKDANDVTISSGTQDYITSSSEANNLGTSAVVDSIAELKLLTAGTYDYVTVLGYYAKTDAIGPRLYYWDSASTLTDNGGSIIKITATAQGRWKLVAGKDIDARWFGAVGNGTTDNSVALANANTYLTTIGGGKLIISYGVYNFITALTFGAIVELCFYPSGYLKSSNGSNLTINKMSAEGDGKRFDSTIGTITLGSSILSANPKWFGAVGDGTSDDSAAIQKCIDSANNVEFPYATYKVTTGITVGVGRKIDFKNSILSPNANDITVLTLNENTSLATKSFIQNLNITNGGSKSSVTGLAVNKSLGANLTNISVAAVETGIALQNASNLLANDISASSCTNSGLNLSSNLTGTGKMVSCVFNSVMLDGNACGLYMNEGASSVLQNIQFNGLTLKDNTVNGAYFEDVRGITLESCNLSGNGSGAASVTVAGSTVYKSDIYLKNSRISLSGETESSLNNSIQLVDESILTTCDYTGYSSATNTHILCAAGSYVVDNGIVTARGYVSGIQKYGELADIATVFIADGVGSCVPDMAVPNLAGETPQYISVSTDSPATDSYTRSDKGLTKIVNFAASVGNNTTNCMSTYVSTFSKAYQISTYLIKSTTSPSLAIEWKHNTASYTHTITLAADEWKRLVFITENKTSHQLFIYPTTDSGSSILVRDTMIYESDLVEDISKIYARCLVGYAKFGDYYTEPPEDGTWEVGDIVYKMAPSSSDPIGWVCTEAGNPGTWKGFGTIA